LSIEIYIIERYLFIRGKENLSNNLNKNKIANKYAKALFDTSLETNNLDIVEDNLHNLSEIMNNSNELKQITINPLLAKSDKLNCLTEIAKKADYCQTTINFLKTLATNNRLFVLPNIIEEFDNLKIQKSNKILVYVSTAKELNKKQEKELIKNLEKSLNKEVIIDYRIDPKILGGLSIKLDTYMLDDSLKNKLKYLELAMKGVE
jgi:F-type H+-transporting ATPase subunit delta